MNYLKYRINNIQFDKTLFLDRDGTIIDSILRKGKISSINKLSELKFKKYVANLNLIKSHFSFNLVLISNQPDISRKIISLDFIKNTNIRILNKINFDHIYICPHLKSDNCKCRKPNTLMIKEFLKKYNQNINNCIFIGDRDPDYFCAKKLKMKFILFKNIYNQNLINKSWKTLTSYRHLKNFIHDNF